MAEYDLDFAENLAHVAKSVTAQGLSDPNAKRTVLYLSLLSTEVTLKAMLEKAGHPIQKIKKRSHDLAGLVRDLSMCRVEDEIAPGLRSLVSASRIRSIPLEYPPTKPTVGKILDAEREGASKYPNQVRYGAIPRHYPPELVAQMALAVTAFARKHWASLCMK